MWIRDSDDCGRAHSLTTLTPANSGKMAADRGPSTSATMMDGAPPGHAEGRELGAESYNHHALIHATPICPVFLALP